VLIGSSTGFLAKKFIIAGTLGCFVRSESSGALYIRSNNHVLADENRVQVCVEVVGKIAKRG
jgi:hypothetical protein